MPIHPDTDRFAGIEETKKGLALRWVSASNPDGVLETVAQFKADLVKLKGSLKPLPEQVRLAEIALQPYELEA